jgi:hypothetical protein
MSSQEQIIITDETIISFYRENPNLDLVSMNHIFINILKDLSVNLTDTLNNSTNAKILSIVKDMNQNMYINKTDIIHKITESKNEYLESIKTILENNSLTNNEKIYNLLEKSNDHLLTKTTLILNDIIPKNQEKNNIQLESFIKTFCASISKDIEKLQQSSTKDETAIENVLKSIDKQFNQLFTSIQQPIFNYIQSSEERTSQGVQQIRENLCIQENTQQKLLQEMNEFLNKYKNNSSLKGKFSEKELYYLLQTIMPTDEIIEVGKETANCDYKVVRHDKTKPSILFENKYYANSVDTKEVTKFERDVQLQKMHGIFISQNSPITFKELFHIDIVNGLVHVYVPNADYDANKIKIAIDLVDSLAIRLDSLSKSSLEISISKEDTETIIEEYTIVMNQKGQLLETIKSFSKNIIEQIEKIQMPKIKQLFINPNTTNENEFKCTFCNKYNGKNKASLAAHLRSCKSNIKNSEENNL